MECGCPSGRRCKSFTDAVHLPNNGHTTAMKRETQKADQKNLKVNTY